MDNLATAHAYYIDLEMVKPREVLGGKDYLTFLQDSQEEHLAQHGTYWQGLPLCPTVPEDGEDVYTVDTAPHDQLTYWGNYLRFVPQMVKAQPRIDVLRYHDGSHSYELRSRFKMEGVTYERVYIGPEPTDWLAIEEPEE